MARDTTPEAIEQEFADSRYGDFKSAVADAVVEYLAPVRERYDAHPRRRGRARARSSRWGADKARAITSGVVDDVRQAMGVGPPR